MVMFVILGAMLGGIAGAATNSWLVGLIVGLFFVGYVYWRDYRPRRA